MRKKEEHKNNGLLRILKPCYTFIHNMCFNSPKVVTSQNFHTSGHSPQGSTGNLIGPDDD